MKTKTKYIFLVSVFLCFLCLAAEVKSQEVPPTPQALPGEPEQTKEQKPKKNFFLFPKNEINEKHRKEQRELLEKHRKENEEISNRHRKELQEAQERIEKEKKEQVEKQIKEKEDTKKTQEIKKTSDNTITTKVREETQKNKETARALIWKRTKEVWRARWRDRYVEVITSDSDPLFIQDANIINTKTKFLGIKGVEFKYKIKLQNQTPKIINSVLLIWERRIPFTDKLTIMRQTKISKPIIPYENRVVEYNDLDSKREGETYKVKVAHVIFEDGTQWKNPVN